MIEVPLIKFFIVFICLYASDIAAFDDTFEKAQREMIAKITKYRQNADPYLRMEIMNAKGIYETSAGRIFKAFSIYCSKQGTADREWGTSYAEDARRELYRNPQLTMIVLLPILREVSEPKEDSLKFQGLPNAALATLILDFALVGESDFAVQQLKEWSQKSDDEELKWCYDYYLKNNLSTISQQYKKNKKSSDLLRLGEYIQRSQLITVHKREWLEKYLGKPASDDMLTYRYICSDCNDVLTVSLGPDGIILRVKGFNLE